jgi:taurine dioxygenase
MSMQLVDLPGPLGVEVLAADLQAPMAPDDVQSLRDALDRRHLLLFRDQQEITGEEQVALCRHFGPIAADGADGYLFISNARDDGVLREGALVFHSDFAFTDDPVHGIALLALEVPSGGAPTLFADASRVLDRMEPSFRERLEHSTIVNVFDFTLPNDGRMRERDIAPGSPVIEKPMVVAHPRTGVPVVQANAMHTDRVVGLDERESDTLLEELFEALYADGNVFVLDWQVGDLALWDNIALQHCRPDFRRTAARTMRRVCIHHKSTMELVPNILDLTGP